MRRPKIGTVAVAVVALLLAVGVGTGLAGGRPTDGGTAAAGIDATSAIVQLKGDPLSTYVRTKPAPGKKIDFSSSTVKSYRAQLTALRNSFKQWLKQNAPAAKVTGEFDISLNAVAVQLNGVALGTIASAPMVSKAQYEGVYTVQDDDDPDLSLINAQAAWAATGGAANAGRGVKIGIVDTGIDITHPCFSDAGFPATTQLGDHRFTNNKVIVAKVFYNKAANQGLTPEAIQEHGTHVAGTAACDLDTPVNVNGVDVPYDMSGVAPAAQLGNYAVFPGEVGNARSEDILNALDAAYADGMDVVNMSLGGGSHGIQDLLMDAVNDLDQANMISAVAAGNSGPGHFTVESPGAAARALTAGASTVGHFIATPIIAPSDTYAGASGDFATVSEDLTAPLEVVTGSAINGLSNACSAFPANSLTGDIVLVTRGTCTFSTKIRNAQDAGAVAVLVGNSVLGDPIAMGQDGTPNQPTIPAYMISRTDAASGALQTDDGSSITISASQAYFYSGNNNIMASFSSQGPTDVDFRVKPDVVAPGVNVLSSIPHQFCDTPPCFAFFQGTSMATPHLAGSAAVVKGAHPGWSAAQIRSAVVNTANQTALFQTSDITKTETDVNIIGAGLDDLLAAVGTQVALDPVSVSFGSVPSGSGQSATKQVTVSNLTGGALNVSVSITAATGSGVSYSASPAAVSLPAGGSATVAVTMTATKGAGLGGHQAALHVGAAHAVVFTWIK